MRKAQFVRCIIEGVSIYVATDRIDAPGVLRLTHAGFAPKQLEDRPMRSYVVR